MTTLIGKAKIEPNTFNDGRSKEVTDSHKFLKRVQESDLLVSNLQ